MNLLGDTSAIWAQLHYAACSEVERVNEMRKPSRQYRPAVYIDGKQWCALYGENLQDGVAGFGDSPELAMEDFDKQWSKRL